MTIKEAGILLRGREISSEELTSQSLERILKWQPKLNAFLTVLEDTALARARRMDEEIGRGELRGPLHGVPVAVKDVFCTRGVRTTCGSKLFTGHVPDYDAAVVERLNAAGAVLVGKTSLHELAYGITSDNPHFGAVHNPWALERIPGGSSGGSGAAVAAGMVPMAMGSDTGGSIRIPASFCGTVGFKPAFGRVSRYGVMPLNFTLDHMGPLTRSVRDAAITLNVLAGHDPRDGYSSREPIREYLPSREVSIHDLRLGLPMDFYFDDLDAEAGRAVRNMAGIASSLGAKVIEVSVPDIASINTIGRVILLAEASTVMEPYLNDRDMFGADVLALLDQGRLMPATDYINAQRLRRLAQNDFLSVWKQVDCLLTPTTPMAAPEIGRTEVRVGTESEDVRLASTRLVRAVNVLGLPALSIPAGFTQEGLPLGLQIIAKPYRDDLVLRVGAALEDATDHHTKAPPGMQ